MVVIYDNLIIQLGFHLPVDANLIADGPAENKTPDILPVTYNLGNHFPAPKVLARPVRVRTGSTGFVC